MKFSQIAVATDSKNGATIYALSVDGDVYQLTGRYVKKFTKTDGGTRNDSYFVNRWEKVDEPFADPGNGLEKEDSHARSN